MHQYSTAGIKTIKLEVIDTGGLTSTATQQITVTGDSNTQPIASFTVTPFSGNTDTQFSFDASECTDNEDPLSLLQVRWDWENDGTWDMNYSTAKTATHQYVTEGTKTIKLEVIDTGGLTNSTTNQISVINIQKADLKLENINMSPTSGSSGTSVSLTFDVRNIGSSTAGGYRTKIYWSTDTDIGGGDLVLADTLKTNNTPVNYYARFPMHVTVPSDYSLGTYYIGIHIDTDNQVSETDESNNKDHKPFNISGSETGTVMDIDGNVYQTVKIGNQWWMAENLKVTHYRNGDTIQNVIENSEWASLSTGAYCVYNNDEGNVDTYGRLYNWYAVNDERKIAPQGWHVSTNEDWQTLADYLGGESVAGGKLKETGTSHWFSPNTGATNESGFTALPGGARRIPGDFFDMGGQAHFRSATERNNNNAYYWTMYCVNSEVRLDSYYKQDGFSVRCVKD
jgi:uncharacterized protein (TIGR02145 family)